MSESIYQQRLAEISAMPDGPEKDAALAALARDYEGEADLAGAQMKYGNQAVEAGAPGVTQTGGRFGTTVAANPLEHIASGLRTYGGYKDMREAKDAMKSGSADKQKALLDMLSSALRR